MRALPYRTYVPFFSQPTARLVGAHRGPARRPAGRRAKRSRALGDAPPSPPAALAARAAGRERPGRARVLPMPDPPSPPRRRPGPGLALAPGSFLLLAERRPPRGDPAPG